MVFYPKYPQEVFDFIKESNLTGKALRDKIKAKFGYDIPRTSIYSLTRHHRHGKAYTHGHCTPSWLLKPEGSERLDKDGYIKVRVGNGERLKHRLVWEQAHGELKRDEIIMFLDGNKTNCALDNLIKVKKKITGCLNQYLRGVAPTPELRKSAILAATLAVEAREKEIQLRKGSKKAYPKKDMWREIVALHEMGKNANEISKTINRKTGTIYWTIRRYKLGYYEEYMLWNTLNQKKHILLGLMRGNTTS